MARIVALLAYDVGQKTSPGIYEPVADLVYGEVGAARQMQLLVLGGIGVVAVVVEPHLEHFHAVLGQIAPAFAVILLMIMMIMMMLTDYEFVVC